MRFERKYDDWRDDPGDLLGELGHGADDIEPGIPILQTAETMVVVVAFGAAYVVAEQIIPTLRGIGSGAMSKIIGRGTEHDS